MSSFKYGIKPLTQGAVEVTFYTAEMVVVSTATFDSEASVEFAAALNRVVSTSQAALHLGLTE